MLHRGADILILDEPTAVLTAQEIAELFKVLRDADRRGRLGDLHHAQAARGARDRRPRDRAAARQEDRHRADRGRDRGEPRQADGRPRRAVPRREGRRRKPARRSSRSRASRSRTTAGCPRVRGLSLQARAGEIVGIAGVDGNGQSELVEAITGLRAPVAGHVRVGGRDITGTRRPRRARGRRRPHRRGPPPARPRARLHARREPRAARVPARAAQPLRAALAQADGRSRRGRCSSSTTCAAAGPRRRPARCRAATSRRS